MTSLQDRKPESITGEGAALRITTLWMVKPIKPSVSILQLQTLRLGLVERHSQVCWMSLMCFAALGRAYPPNVVGSKSIREQKGKLEALPSVVLQGIAFLAWSGSFKHPFICCKHCFNYKVSLTEGQEPSQARSRNVYFSESLASSGWPFLSGAMQRPGLFSEGQVTSFFRLVITLVWF